MGLYLIAAEFSWLSLDSWLAILKVAVGLGFVIFVHELGHFLVAKACGVKCEKFYIGFDFFDIKLGPIVIPRSLVKFQWGETEYGVGIIPLGGYVKMLGQDDNPANAAREAERVRVAREKQNQAEHHHPHIPHGDLPPEPTQEMQEEYILDPRSYPAKSVPQRMAIISAGVIMNLIFAVIFATIAFREGVEYTPAMVGQTIPGGPAWQVGLEPGDRVLQVGREGVPSERMRFTWDLLNNVGVAGVDDDLPLLVRHPDGEEEWIDVRPSKDVVEGINVPMIGIAPAQSNRLSSRDPVIPHTPAGNASPPFKPGDTIVAIEGEPTKDGQEVRRVLAKKADDELTFTVRRIGKDRKAQTVDIHVGPNPVRSLGLIMEMKGVEAIQQDSPAAEAGFEKGDVVTAVNGEPVGDPLLLPLHLRRLAGEEVAIDVLRKGDSGRASRITLKVTPEQPDSYWIEYMPNRPVPAEAIGLVYYVGNKVADVVPGSPADKAGLQAGDLIESAEFKPADEEKQAWEEKNVYVKNVVPFVEKNDEKANWPIVHGLVQSVLPDTRVELAYRRGSTMKTAILTPVELDEWHQPQRGIKLEAASEFYRASSWSESIALGARQTKEDALKVLGFLKSLVTRNISVTNLGGPGSIAVVATSEAAEGTARLLMFLTFLSANLAVLNFLPIPVLDGGHMMFLIAEGIRGKPLDEKWLVRLTVAGFAFVISLMLFVIGLDVVRLSGLSS